MNRKALTVLGIQLEWLIIIVALIYGTIVIMIYLKHYEPSWLPLQ